MRLNSLVQAAESLDVNALTETILGRTAPISSPIRMILVQDKNKAMAFAAKAKGKNRRFRHKDAKNPNRAILTVGRGGGGGGGQCMISPCFRFPIERQKGKWVFDTIAAGGKDNL
jgi:hypothetical protein